MYIVISLLIIISGLLLEFSLGSGFIFSYASEYRLLMMPVFIALIPVIWVLLSRSKAATNSIVEQLPTKWVRTIVFPLMVILGAFVLVFFPLGWIAVYGWAMGSTAQILPAQITSVRHSYSRRKGCNQNAVITVGGLSGRICITGRLAGRTPIPGQTVTVVASQSSIGYYISEVRSK